MSQNKTKTGQKLYPNDYPVSNNNPLKFDKIYFFSDIFF